MFNRSPADRVRNGLVVLTTIFIVAVFAYHSTGEYNWSEAIWMVVVTISSVGYSETPSSKTGVQWISIAVILIGMTVAAYTFGGMVRMTVEGELDKVLGSRKLSRDLKKLRDHVIVCGYGRIGQELCQSLHSLSRSFVVIDSDTDRLELAREREHLAVHGDATSDETLREVGIERARTIVSALPSDAHNVFLTLTARNLNPPMMIIARAERVSTEIKLKQAGANRVVTPAITGARQMTRMITRPTTADLIDLVSETESLDLELDEISLLQNSIWAGKELHEISLIDKRKILVLAIKNQQGDFAFNPDESHQLHGGDTLVVMGHGNDIRHLQHELNVVAKP